MDDADVQALILINTLTKWIREPFLEILLAAEDLRHQEMHQRPQLHHIVLQRGSCQEQPPSGVESEQSLPPLALEIFDVLSLIQNHVIPLFAPKDKMVLNHQLVGRDAHMEGVVLTPALPLEFALLLSAEVRKNLETRAPSLELHLPVDHDRRRHDDQVRSPDASVARKRGEERYGLNSLSKTHFVSQNPIQPLVVKSDEPIESDDLVLSQRPVQEERNLGQHIR